MDRSPIRDIHPVSETQILAASRNDCVPGIVQ
jgi:hypothetical protein